MKIKNILIKIISKPQIMAILVMIVLLFMLSIVSPNYFSRFNITSKFRTMLPLILVAIGQSFVIFGGGIDLSVSSLLALINVSIVSTIMHFNGSTTGIALSLILSIILGLSAGAITGSVVVFLRLPAFISTYAMQIVWSGVALYIMPESGGEIPMKLYSLYASSLFVIPLSLIILMLVYGVCVFLKKIGYLNHLKACGGNINGAIETALPVKKLLLTSYMLCGLFTSLAAFCIVSETITGNPLSGAGYDLSSVSAVALGGSSLSGGYGNISGSIIGVAVLRLIDDLIFFLGLSTNFQTLMQGLIIILALTSGNIIMRFRTSIKRVDK